MVSLRDIKKCYSGKQVTNWVLRGISLQVDQGDFLTIMGPSGSGKSTLLHIIGMLDDCSSGEYLFKGTDVMSLGEKQRAELHREHIGFVFQAYHLIDELTVYENLETPLLYQKVKGPDRKSRVCDILDRFNIVGKKDLFPGQLSGGQQQLVGVARAVIASPSLILADEPTGNLSSKEGEAILRLFQDLNRNGTTILQVTHSGRNAEYGKRTIELLDGAIVDERVTA